MFTDMARGASTLYDETTGWFNHKLDISQRRKKPPAPDAQRFDGSWPLVFAYHDLNMWNILLASDGTVYLLC
jgi:hypothetical protein